MKGWFFYVVKFVSWIILRVGFGLEVRGQEHVPASGTFIVASNHVSFLDPVVVGVACPRRVCFMARSTLFAHPLLGWFLRGTRVIPLKRGEADLGAVREAVRRLHEGEPIAIFPEGGRQLSGRLGQARRGVGLVATTARVPIVPVLVRGTFQAMPPGENRLHRAKIRVAFGPQIPYTGERFLPAPSSPLGETGPADWNDPGRRQAGGTARHRILAEAVTQSWHRLGDLEPAHRDSTIDDDRPRTD